MQKGGRIKFDGGKWVVDAKYRHFASEKEAEALNLLGFKPSNDKNTTMSTGVYKNIYKKNEGFNSSIITAFKESSYLNKKKIVQLFLEAALLRYKASLKNRSGTDSDGTHDFYQNLLSSLGESLQQEIDNLPIRTQVGTPLRTPIRKQTKKRRLSYEPERHVKKKHYSFISKLLPDDLSKLVKNLYPEFDESILDEDSQLQSINTDENQYNNLGNLDNHNKFNEEDILNFFKDLSLGNNVDGRKKTRKRKKKRKRENKEKERTKKKREQRKRENKEKERTKERK